MKTILLLLFFFIGIRSGYSQSDSLLRQPIDYYWYQSGTNYFPPVYSVYFLPAMVMGNVPFDINQKQLSTLLSKIDERIILLQQKIAGGDTAPQWKVQLDEMILNRKKISDQIH